MKYQVILEVDQCFAVGGQPGCVDVEVVGGQSQELAVRSLYQVGGEDLAVAVGASRAGHGEGVVVPGDSNQTKAVRFPGQLTNRVVSGDVVDGAELESGHLKRD